MGGEYKIIKEDEIIEIIGDMNEIYRIGKSHVEEAKKLNDTLSKTIKQADKILDNVHTLDELQKELKNLTKDFNFDFIQDFVEKREARFRQELESSFENFNKLHNEMLKTYHHNRVLIEKQSENNEIYERGSWFVIGGSGFMLGVIALASVLYYLR